MNTSNRCDAEKMPQSQVKSSQVTLLHLPIITILIQNPLSSLPSPKQIKEDAHLDGDVTRLGRDPLLFLCIRHLIPLPRPRPLHSFIHHLHQNCHFAVPPIQVDLI